LAAGCESGATKFLLQTCAREGLCDDFGDNVESERLRNPGYDYTLPNLPGRPTMTCAAGANRYARKMPQGDGPPKKEKYRREEVKGELKKRKPV
jgi:hypothetical protein